jgi:hypothetical protein
LLENIFRSVNIALVNELAQLCDRMDIDVWEVVGAAATKPFGFMSFQPGPGLGGHCIPLDPFYLSWKAREYDFTTRFIDLSGEVNNNMPYFCRSVISQAVNHGLQRSCRARDPHPRGRVQGDIGDLPARRSSSTSAPRGGSPPDPPGVRMPRCCSSPGLKRSWSAPLRSTI